MTALILYEAACRAIAEAKRVDEVQSIRNGAEATRAAARIAKNRSLEIDAAEIRLRAERRLGELIGQQGAVGALSRGGRPSLKTGSQTNPVSAPPTLAEIGVDKSLADRSRKLAAVPEAEFEAQLGEWRDRVGAENERVTVNLLREGEKRQRQAENQRPAEGGGRIEDLHALAATGWRAGAILADPPWHWMARSERGNDRSASQHYGTMALDDIKALPVATIAAEDAVLHLWVLGSMLKEGIDVLAAWGFTLVKVGFIWNKTTDDGSARRMITGYWTRDEAEICLFGTRGHPKRLDAAVRQTLDAPLGEHSEKPREFHRRIERLTAGPYLELFGRAHEPGWIVWGNQAEWRAPELGPSTDIANPSTENTETETATAGPETIDTAGAAVSRFPAALDIPAFLKRKPDDSLAINGERT